MRGCLTVFFWLAYAYVELMTLFVWGSNWGLVGAFIAFVFIPSPLITPFVAGGFPVIYDVVLVAGIAAWFVGSHLDNREAEKLQLQTQEDPDYVEVDMQRDDFPETTDDWESNDWERLDSDDWVRLDSGDWEDGDFVYEQDEDI